MELRVPEHPINDLSFLSSELKDKRVVGSVEIANTGQFPNLMQ